MLFKIAWRNLFLHRKKSLAALLSIIMAFVSLSLFQGYMHDVKNMYLTTYANRQMLGDLIIERKDINNPGKSRVDGDSLGREEQQWLEQYLAKDQSKIQNVVPFLNIDGFINAGRTQTVFIGMAYDLESGYAMRSAKYRWNTFAGKPLEMGTENTVILGKGVADILGCRADQSEVRLNGVLGYEPVDRPFRCEEPIVQLQVSTESGQANVMDFSVGGLLATGFAELDQYMVMIPLQTAQKLYDSNRVSFYALALQSGLEKAEWISEFNQAAEDAGIALTAQSWQDHAFGDLFQRTMEFLNIFRNFVITIILVVVVMAIMNTFVKIVHERMREIGTLRSLGYQPSHILKIFTWEAFLLGSAGSILGIGVAWLAAKLCNGIGLTYKAGFLSEAVPFQVDLVHREFIGITVLVILLTIFSTLTASWRGTKKAVAEVLIS